MIGRVFGFTSDAVQAFVALWSPANDLQVQAAERARSSFEVGFEKALNDFEADNETFEPLAVPESAVGFYDCPCGGDLEVFPDEDGSRLDAWIERHRGCKLECGRDGCLTVHPGDLEANTHWFVGDGDTVATMEAVGQNAVIALDAHASPVVAETLGGGATRAAAEPPSFLTGTAIAHAVVEGNTAVAHALYLKQ